MRIDISDLKQQPGASAAFSGEEGLKSLEFMGEDICFAKPLQVEATATNTDVGFLVHGTVHAVMDRECGRCTVMFSEPVDAEFTMLYRQIESVHSGPAHQGDTNEAESEEDVVYFKGNHIDLMDIIIESIVMNIPMRSICSDDCLGLCPVCGQNLNEGTCSCADENVDVRLAALKELLNKE